MTYAKIIHMLQQRGCDSTRMSLERAVEDEMRALIDGTSRYRGIRSAASKRGLARQDAEAYYAGDITEQLQNPVEPTPSRMLSLRRFPTVWAVVEVIRTNRLVCVKCENYIIEPGLNVNKSERYCNCTDT